MTPDESKNRLSIAYLVGQPEEQSTRCEQEEGQVRCNREGMEGIPKRVEAPKMQPRLVYENQYRSSSKKAATDSLYLAAHRNAIRKRLASSIDCPQKSFSSKRETAQFASTVPYWQLFKGNFVQLTRSLAPSGGYGVWAKEAAKAVYRLS